MKIMNKILLASVVLPLAFTTGSALANGEKGNKSAKHQHECRVELNRGIMKKLDLTDGQKAQFETLRNDARADRKNKAAPEEHKTERKEKLDAVRALLFADKFDAATATKIAQEMAQKRIQQQVKQLNQQFKMIRILTPEQKEKLVEIQDKRLHKCMEKMSKRHNK